jgi:hypothetical protein
MTNCGLAASFGIALLALATDAGAGERAPNPALILSYADYARIEPKSPVTLEYAAGEGRLLLVGVAHSLEFNSATVGNIWRAFGELKPTIAFYEGWGWPMGADQETVGRYGEPAVVRVLAYANRVPVTSLEPEFAHEIDHLRTRWNDDQIRPFYTLRFVAEGTGYGGQASSDAEVLEFLTTGFPPTIGGPPSTIAELDDSYRKYFPPDMDWRMTPVAWFDPTSNDRFTNQMAAASGRYRGEYMLPQFVERVRRGDRVFVAVGYYHVRMLEPALTDALGPPIRRLIQP